MLMLFLLCGIGGCKAGNPLPNAYQFNAAIATMSGTYTSNVIPIHYYISISSPREGTMAIPAGYADIYSIVEYSTNGGVKYNLCHNTQGHPGDYRFHEKLQRLH